MTASVTTLQKIAIIGSSCSGKTTLAKQLSTQLGLKRIELDEINWLANWQERDYDEFREMVDIATREVAWVVDGNYNSRLNGLTLQRADTIIWLNLPFLTVYGRLFARLYRRIILGETLWNGNRETLLTTLFRTDSLIYWIPRRYQIIRRGYRQFFEVPEQQKKLIEFHDAKSIDAWLKTLGSP